MSAVADQNIFVILSDKARDNKEGQQISACPSFVLQAGNESQDAFTLFLIAGHVSL